MVSVESIAAENRNEALSSQKQTFAPNADTSKPEEVAAAKPAEATLRLVSAPVKPVHSAAKSKARKKKLADAKLQVPRPPAALTGSANGDKPR